MDRSVVLIDRHNKKNTMTGSGNGLIVQHSAIHPFDAHCCHMGTSIKHPVPDRLSRHLLFLTSGHSDAQP